VRVVDGRIAPPAAMWQHAAAAAVVLIFAFLFMLHAIALGPASVLVPIAQMGFVVSAALGILVLGEPMTARKGAGLAAALATLGVMAFG
jgi:transporter family protein